MNKKELIETIADRTGRSKRSVREILNAFTDVVGDTLAEGGRVQITKFGTFSVTTYAERMGRNPRTGEMITITEKKKPKFKAGSELSEKVN